MRSFLKRIEVQSERRQGQLELIQFPDALVVRGTHDALNKLATAHWPSARDQRSRLRRADENGARDGRLDGRQLQHGRVLAYAYTSEQHDLTIGELKRVVMHVRLLLLDLPEPSHRMIDLLRFPLEKAPPKSRNHTLDFAFERDLGARK